MRIRIIVLLLVSVIVSTGCFSGGQALLTENNPEPQKKNHPIETDMHEDEVITESADYYEEMDFLTPFDQHLTQAKVHYVDALIAQDENDSLEVEFQLSIVFDILARIESYNTMDEIQYGQFRIFTDKLVREFQNYDPQMRALHEQFTLSDLQTAMSNMTDDYFAGFDDKDYVVLEDRDGHLPIIINSRVESAIKMFQTRRRGDMQNWIRDKAIYDRLFRSILREHRVPEEFIYLSMLESELKTDARSYVGAMGQWQFMDYTAKSFGLKFDYWVDERRDPIKSTEAAARYMLYLYEEFNDWYLVMAAYNAGEGRVGRSIRYERTRDYWKLRTLPRATRNYVPYILAVAAISIEPEKYGFTDFPPLLTWGDFDTLTLNQSYELETIARVCGVSYNRLRDLNPELRKLITPPYSYVIRLPKGKREILAKELNVMEAAPTHVVYSVRAGDTLSEIGLRYSVTVQDIVRTNKLDNKSRIYVGQKLIIPQGGASYQASVSPQSRSSASSTTGKPDLSASHRKIVYEVKPGDTLGEIAEIYDTRASRIRVWNGLVYGEHIYPKQKLNIWVPKGNTYDTVKQYYTVKAGDSFERIARNYGVSVNELKKLNPNINYSRIYPGDKIRIQ
jgi:membrane-bound lytic murein transglycosylase D